MTLVHQWTVPGKYTFAKDRHVVQFFAIDTSDNGNCVGSLTFQDGPIYEHGENGTTNEEVIRALIERLEALNQGPYTSPYNDTALMYLRAALHQLEARTQTQVARGMEDTSTP